MKAKVIHKQAFKWRKLSEVDVNESFLPNWYFHQRCLRWIRCHGENLLYESFRCKHHIHFKLELCMPLFNYCESVSSQQCFRIITNNLRLERLTSEVLSLFITQSVFVFDGWVKISTRDLISLFRVKKNYSRGIMTPQHARACAQGSNKKVLRKMNL